MRVKDLVPSAPAPLEVLPTPQAARLRLPPLQGRQTAARHWVASMLLLCMRLWLHVDAAENLTNLAMIGRLGFSPLRLHTSACRAGGKYLL